jgi:rhamnose utilization protein RhaD (predicted bifunctional aldolase and dehydrogenase)/NAD(P)-dependent dehydrogenase (short-subunit alcohol dehydrogenase family)
MKSLWNESEAAECKSHLDLRVYSSRLLGRDPTLVLHGGGNTSVKVTETNLVGEEEEILYVKGSGWDLATIEAAGFAPVRLAPMVKLAQLDSLSDPRMVNELKSQMTLASAPSPSVETILHAVLPFRYVDHTHADAVVTITNTPDGRKLIDEIYGNRVVVIPYVMPGFDLARDVARIFARQAGPETIGMVLMNHGIFSFGDTARDSYERMIQLVDRAEGYLKSQDAWAMGEVEPPVEVPMAGEVAALRRELSAKAGRPMILNVTGSPRGMAFARRYDLRTVATRGPATPDHVIRTKAVPMIGRDLDGYEKSYKDYFMANEPAAKGHPTMLDPAPRVILDRGLGLCCAGKSIQDASIVHDIYEHTMVCIDRAERLGGWRALSAADLFNMEYWDLEQAKLRKGGKPPLFQGGVVLITGAASGIGKACVEAFLARGAAVIGLDIAESVRELHSNPGYAGICCDITDPTAVNEALEQGVRRFGGIDMLLLNAGMFPGGKRVAQLSDPEWRQVMSVNLDANLTLLREVHPFLQLAPQGGRVVIMGSKNVPAPGPGAAAYSASKAALTQLMRVVAMEWGDDGIRVNSLHPNAVFDTGIWTEEVLQARAQHYGLTVQEYKTNNLLGVEVTSRDVAELTAEMCGPLFAKTTGAQLPIDGGNDRVV